MEIIGERLGTNETCNSVFCKYSLRNPRTLRFRCIFSLWFTSWHAYGAKIRLGLFFKVVTITKLTDTILESSVVYFRSCSPVIELIFSCWLKNVLGLHMQTASIVILTNDWKRCISSKEGCFCIYPYNLLDDVHCRPSRCACITYGVMFFIWLKLT